jgi:hypothetical protein
MSLKKSAFRRPPKSLPFGINQLCCLCVHYLTSLRGSFLYHFLPSSFLPSLNSGLF